MKSMALIYAMAVMGQNMPVIECEQVVKKDTSHLRKKCKSCKQFKGSFCTIKSYANPMNVACEKYEKK